MTTSLSPMQEAFEAWVVNQNVVTKYNANLKKSWNNQFYLDYRINDRWVAWQAAHGRPIVFPEAIIDSWPNKGAALGYNRACRDCKAELERQGFTKVSVGGVE